MSRYWITNGSPNVPVPFFQGQSAHLLLGEPSSMTIGGAPGSAAARGTRSRGAEGAATVVAGVVQCQLPISAPSAKIAIIKKTIAPNGRARVLGYNDFCFINGSHHCSAGNRRGIKVPRAPLLEKSPCEAIIKVILFSQGNLKMKTQESQKLIQSNYT